MFRENKSEKRHFGAYFFLYRSFSADVNLTCDLHDTLNQKKNFFFCFYFYWKGILMQFEKKKSFSKKNNTKVKSS